MQITLDEIQNLIPSAELNCNMLYLRLLLKTIQGLKLIQSTVCILLVLWESVPQKSCCKAIYVRKISQYPGALRDT